MSVSIADIPGTEVLSVSRPKIVSNFTNLKTAVDALQAVPVVAQRVERSAKRIAFPLGLKIRGANILGKAGHLAWNDTWGPFWDWEGWIKPQIDAAAGIGANVIRFIGGPSAVLYGQLTRAQYLARQKQFVEYCLLKGLYVYGQSGDFGQYTYSNAGGQETDWNGRVLNEILAYAAFLDPYPHIIGIDVNQEGFYGLPSGMSVSAAHTLYAGWFTSIRAVTNIPLTISNPSPNPNNDSTMWTDGTNISAVAAYSDFIDFHCYYNATSSEASAAFAYTGDLQCIVGESGIDGSNTQSDQTARYVAIANLLNAGPFVGGLAWAIVGTYGMFNDSFVAHTYITDVFQTWLKVVPASSIPDPTGQTNKYLQSNGSALVYANAPTGQTYINLDVTYYGSSSGSDLNTGLSIGSPKTVQGMLSMVDGVKIAKGIKVTMQIANGTTNTAGLTAPTFDGQGSVTIQGNTSNESAVVINCTNSGATVLNITGGNWEVRYLKFTGACYSAISCAGTLTQGQKLRFAGVATFNLIGISNNNAVLILAADCDTVYLDTDTAGGGSFYYFSQPLAVIVPTTGLTINCGGGTRSFQQFMKAELLSRVVIYTPDASTRINVSNGSIVGSHYVVNGNSVLQSFIGDANNFFPGNSSGSTATGGQIV
jgi:hypothetical protein